MHAATLVVGGGLVAKANDITFMFTHMSSQSVVVMFATVIGGSEQSRANILQSGELTAAASSEVRRPCVYELKIQFSDGSIVDRPDVDLCQTDEMVIQ